MFSVLNSVKAIAKYVTKTEEGATMVEYGIMVALIAAVCIGTVTTIGTGVLKGFTTVNSGL